MWYLLLVAPLLHSAVANIPNEIVVDEKREVANIVDGDEEMFCNCVKFVVTRRQDIPFIDASQMVIATSTPYAGAVVKMYYPHSGLYHVGIVVSVMENEIEVLDANYSHCELTQRVVPKNDTRILGYL